RFGHPSGVCPPGNICGGSFGPLGSEFQVASVRDSIDLFAGLAMSGQGSFVVGWNDLENATAADHGIFAQYFDPDGTPRGGLFQVNEPGSTYYRSAAGMDAAGNFLMAWEGGNDGSFSGIYARRFLQEPSLSIDDVRVTEGDSGSTNAVFTVT